MRFRKLRIAWSVAWGIGCVLLIVLWVRSYIIQRQFKLIDDIDGISTEGSLILLKPAPVEASPFDDEFVPITRILQMPYWSITLLSASLAVVPWIRRFSLRTMLIATMMVAVGLGLAVYAVRK
jgi:hypothetical protein